MNNIKRNKMLPPCYTSSPIKATFKYGFDAVANVLGNLEGKYVLDYGSGTGRSVNVLKSLGANVVGVDISQDLINEAKKQHPDVDFKLMQNNKIPFSDNTFDVVFSSFVHIEISNLEPIEQFTKEIFRVLKPGGIYLILTANPEVWGNKYESFSSTLPPDFTGKSGQKVNTIMKTEKGEIVFQDYYWKKEDYIKILKLAGFKIKESKKIHAENNPPPFLLINSFK